MTRILTVCAASIFLFSSCVTNKKYVYLQKNDVNEQGLQKDSVIRSYEQVPYNYRIQPNDALYVRFESLTSAEYNFFESDQGSGGAGGQNLQLRSELVAPDGTLNYPVIGRVKVAGLTVFEAQDTLQALANAHLQSPVVKVRLVNFRFTVLGEVTQEGTFTTLNNRVSLPEALGISGGLGELANRREVKIIRQLNGKTEVGYVDLLDEKLMESPYYFINQNDILVVPPLRQRPFRKYFTQNVSILLSATSIVLLIISLSN